MSNYWNDGTSLYHYGISGQKWGVRRFQNADGSLTEEGRRRYGVVGDARTKAEQFKSYALEGRSNFEKQRHSSNTKVTKNTGKISESDIDRWIKVTKVQEKYYDDIIKRFSQTDVSKIDKKTLKDAKDFVKNAFFVDADYSDVALGGNKYDNYQLNYKGVDNWSKNRGRK